MHDYCGKAAPERDKSRPGDHASDPQPSQKLADEAPDRKDTKLRACRCIAVDTCSRQRQRKQPAQACRVATLPPSRRRRRPHPRRRCRHRPIPLSVQFGSRVVSWIQPAPQPCIRNPPCLSADRAFVLAAHVNVVCRADSEGIRTPAGRAQ